MAMRTPEEWQHLINQTKSTTPKELGDQTWYLLIVCLARSNKAHLKTDQDHTGIVSSSLPIAGTPRTVLHSPNATRHLI